MAFEKTIAELDRIRNIEYERLRYDRRVWSETKGVMMSDLKMIDAAKNDVRTPEELDILENEQRMIKFYGNKFYNNEIHATEEEVAELVKFYKKEMPEHKNNVKKAIENYNSGSAELQFEIQNIINKYKPRLKESLKVLANLQQDENYIFNSKGIPEEFKVDGINKYREFYKNDLDFEGPLTSYTAKNYVLLYKNEKVLLQSMLENFKEAII